MKFLLELVNRNNNSPTSFVIYTSDKYLNYNDLQSAVYVKIKYLIDNGVQKDDIVPIISENNVEFIVSVFALWQIGAIPAPLNSKFLQKDLIAQVAFLGAKYVLKGNELRIEEKDFSTGNKVLKKENEVDLNDFSTNDTALILFTSGSSGKPKAVELSFNNLIQSSLIGNGVLNQTSKDKWLASLPFYHIGGFSILFRSIMFGTSLIIPSSLSNEDLSKSVVKYKPTLTSLVSNQLNNFIRDDFIPNEELRIVLLGGGFSSNELILKAIEKGWNICKVYGSTETSSFITFMVTEEVKNRPNSSGKIIPLNEIIITNEGEIAVKGPTIMKRYFNDPNETEAKLQNNFYYTGDIGYFDEEDYLYIEAKRTDLIVSGGENINPIEVEEAIKLNKAVSEVCVIGIEDDKWGQTVSAAIVLKENFNLSVTDLTNFLKGKLPSFKVPKSIIFVK